VTETRISGPVIARLLACSRMTANENMRAGAYGPLLRLGRIQYAALAAVERRVGQRFSPEQIAIAVAGRPDRIIVFHDQEIA
jgi:hypothetical protein